mmetsp:Transcript_3930/g.8444  ORF Transcript_3930/g.8444 Transcript_3930/m.8444 type:complete len:250 (-) Transcript_3930:1202-1951(-)
MSSQQLSADAPAVRKVQRRCLPERSMLPAGSRAMMMLMMVRMVKVMVKTWRSRRKRRRLGWRVRQRMTMTTIRVRTRWTRRRSARRRRRRHGWSCCACARTGTRTPASQTRWTPRSTSLRARASRGTEASSRCAPRRGIRRRICPSSMRRFTNSKTGPLYSARCCIRKLLKPTRRRRLLREVSWKWSFGCRSLSRSSSALAATSMLMLMLPPLPRLIQGALFKAATRSWSFRALTPTRTGSLWSTSPSA